QAEEVRAAGHHRRAAARELERLGHRLGPRVRARLHWRLSASRTRFRVIGAVRTRTPIAFATALPTAAGSGMIGGSPRPFAPMLFAFASGSSMNPTGIFGPRRT